MAHPKLPSVRLRFQFGCGYCGVTETDVGGELTVDHFLPVSAGGVDDEENLVYACVRCNQYKGALYVEGTDPALVGRLLHPSLDSLAEHLHEDPVTGRLEPLTASGRFQIEVLRLNRPALIANRQRRRLMALLKERLEQALHENVVLAKQLACQEAYVATLERLLERRRAPESEG
jgi:hypothetical protein